MGQKKYIISLLFINAVVLISFVFVNLYVDPFHRFDKFHYNKNEDLSLRANYRLYKLMKYKNKPLSHIVLGDSRIDALDASEISHVSGKEYANLAFGGASLNEIIQTFWSIANQKQLAKVFIGLNLSIYNTSYNFNQVSEALNLIDNPTAYLLSPFVFKVSYYQWMYNYDGRVLLKETPAVNKEQFWKQQIDNTKNFYGKYAYPEKLLIKLKKIGEYCKDNNIDLNFVIPPSHADLQQQVAVYGLEEHYNQFKEDIALIAPVIDFDFINNYTKDRNNFKDPYHMTEEMESEVIKDIWLKPNLTLSRRLKR